MKKILSLILVSVIAASVCSISVFAYERPKNVSVSGSKSVRVGGSIQMSVRITPSDFNYDDIEWRVDDYSMADIDEYGVMTGLVPGEVTVSCRVYGPDDSGKSVRVGAGSRTVTIYSNLVDGKIAEPSSSSSSTKSPEPQSPSGGKISSSAVNEAVKKALVRGTTARAGFKDAGSISASALQSAALAMKNGGGTVLLNFDTMNGKSVEGRLTLNPLNAGKATGDIQLGLYTNDEAVSKTRAKFQKFFQNDVVIIKAAHSGFYEAGAVGDPELKASCAVKIGTSLRKSRDLRLYSYNPDSNKYREISGSNIRIDDNGYVHFTTPVGDYLIVSNGKLEKK